MTVPKGKQLIGSASRARIKFSDSSDDVRSYYAVRQFVKDSKAGQRHLNNIGRGVFVLIAALWEAYCEDLATEAAEYLVEHARTWEDLPPALARRIALDVREADHELSPWTLSGDGWKEVALGRVHSIARQTIFNTPKPDQIDELFKRAIGLPSVSGSWSPVPDKRNGESDAKAALRGFINTRGSIAHGGQPPEIVTKLHISGFYQTVSQLVAETDATVGQFIESRIGQHPWRHGGSGVPPQLDDEGTSDSSTLRSDDFSTPNCETCLQPMVVAGPTSHPYWRCAACGNGRIS